MWNQHARYKLRYYTSTTTTDDVVNLQASYSLRLRSSPVIGQLQAARANACTVLCTTPPCGSRSRKQDVVDLKSWRYRKLDVGGAASSSVIPIYSEYFCMLLCDRTRFDDVCCILKIALMLSPG